MLEDLIVLYDGNQKWRRWWMKPANEYGLSAASRERPTEAAEGGFSRCGRPHVPAARTAGLSTPKRASQSRRMRRTLGLDLPTCVEVSGCSSWINRPPNQQLWEAHSAVVASFGHGYNRVFRYLASLTDFLRFTPPTREPSAMRFCLLDRICSLEPDVEMTAVKNVSLAEEYLADHFPEFPVLPGVFMLEAATQAATWLVRISENYAHSMIVLQEARIGEVHRLRDAGPRRCGSPSSKSSAKTRWCISSFKARSTAGCA